MTDPLPAAFDTWFRNLHPDIPLGGARGVLELARDGATAPFIARYRKERTGNLDAASVRRTLAARDLFERISSRQAILLESIERHATLSPELRERILATFDLDLLEDLYHPYRQQKKNRAREAREAGLQPLADWIWDCGHGMETPHEGQTLELWAFTFRNEEKGIKEAKQAVEGARDILVERLAGDPELRALVRRTYLERGVLRAVKTDKAKAHSKFEAYFAFVEPVASLREPGEAQRFFALRRGQSEGELLVTLGGPPEDASWETRFVAAFEARACSVPDSPGAEVLRHAARIAFKNDVRTSIENEVLRILKDAADAAAARACAENVLRLLLEPPLGPRPVLGVDPGPATGGRLAAVDAAGALQAHAVFQLQTDEQKASAREAIARLARETAIAAVAVGDGNGGREAEIFTRRALREAGIAVPVLLVSEAGASSFATSEAGRAEFPELDPSVRSAASLARRLQDPLAELVKVEPRAFGMGPHHHDVSHAVLQKALDAAVEEAIHGVGLNLNTASPQLLARVAGLSPALAAAVVQQRQKLGPFRSRRQLLEVASLGPHAFEQAAGFLRIPDAAQPLDQTAVHPERYAALESLAARLGKTVGELFGAGASLVRDDAALKAELGEFTFEDVLAELEQKGRDSRGPFVPFSFREDVEKLADLRPGMVCPGVVSNVTSFGAFVDIGVHQDGLVHVSQLGKAFVKEPREVVKPGDRVEVRVLKVDLEKKQVSLTMRPPPARPEKRLEAKPRAARAQRSGAEPRPALARKPVARTAPQRDERAARPGRRPEKRPPRSAPPAGNTPDVPRPSAERPARPERAAEARRSSPARPPAEKRPEARRPAFNNPFAVLAGLKVPPKKDEG